MLIFPGPSTLPQTAKKKKSLSIFVLRGMLLFPLFYINPISLHTVLQWIILTPFSIAGEYVSLPGGFRWCEKELSKNGNLHTHACILPVSYGYCHRGRLLLPTPATHQMALTGVVAACPARLVHQKFGGFSAFLGPIYRALFYHGVQPRTNGRCSWCLWRC